MTTRDEEAAALAKETIILNLFKLYRSWDGKVSRGLTDQYLEPVKRFSTTAVARAYESIRDGGVEEAKDWLPQIPRWVAEVRRFDRPVTPVVELYNGMIEMDFGHGKVDLRGLKPKEQDYIIRNNGMIGGTMVNGKLVGGKNAALMSLEEKRAALRALPAPEPDKTVPMPKLQRMTK